MSPAVHESRGHGAAPSVDDPRVVEAVQEYLAVLETGQQPDRSEFLARHPSIADPLAACLEGLEFLHRARPGISQPGAAVEPALRPEMRLGDFLIVREIGRGGMGVVYEAEQLSLQRRVALKVLPLAAALDAKLLQRFKNEAQAAAHLHQQNIVPVHGVGCERGVHYYAMQFVEGQTVAQIIAELGQAAGLRGASAAAAQTAVSAIARDLASGKRAPLAPTPGAPAQDTAVPPQADMSTDVCPANPAFILTVVKLGVQAAAALEHAHQLGVVHRDIKPGNLLVDVRGKLWITDFGLAHIQTDNNLTLSGDLLGTLRYMSPEQALGNRLLLDHRTDIYSLGVTLYELLTLQPAFAGDDRQALLQRIAFDEPRPLRQLNKQIPRDLETVVRKAMAKLPEERYATAQDLADDLQRVLEDKPIRARRPSVWQRASKWSRRHRSLVAMGAVSLVMVTAVSLGSAALMLRAYRSESAQRRQAELESDRAERNLSRTRATVDKYLTAVAEDARLKQQDLHALRKKLLEAAVPLYEDLAAQKLGDPTLRADQCGALMRLAELRTELGDQEGAARDFGQAAQHLTALAAGDANRAHLQELARAYRGQGRALASLDRLAEAEKAYGQSARLCQRLADDHPEVPAYRLELAKTHNNRGIILRQLSRRDEAEQAYRQALELKERLVTDYPNVADYRLALAMSQQNLGLFFNDLGRHVEAEHAYREALKLRQQLSADHPGIPDYRRDLAWGFIHLGIVLGEVGRAIEGEQALRKALEIDTALATTFSAVPEYRQHLAWCNNHLGDLLRKLGRHAEAERAYRKALELQERLSRDFPSVPRYTMDMAEVCGNFGHLRREAGNPADALRWYDKALDRVRAVLTVQARDALAGAVRRQSLAGKALALAQLRQYTDAASLAHTVAADRELEPDSCYHAAIALALCSAVEQSRSGERDKEAATALELLRRAAAGGYFDDPNTRMKLRSAAELSALRSRQTFVSLLSDLDARYKDGAH